MAAVEGGNRQQVHHCQNDGDKGGDVPETNPVPSRGENAANGAEAAHALGSLRSEDDLELLDVTDGLLPTHLDTARYRLEEVVMDGLRVIYRKQVG